MATAPQNVPVSVLSNFTNQYPITALVIGQNYVQFNFPNNAPAYWFVAVDLTNLSVVQNIVSKDPTAVPPAIQALLGNRQYFLFFVSNWQSTMNMITGPLYTFLQQVGSGTQLASGEQAVEQLGTSLLLSFSYILA